MLPSEVNNVQVSDKMEFDKRGNAVSYQLYTFYIANHGPFSEKFYAGEQHQPAIEKRISDRVLTLRNLGLLEQK